MKNYLINKIEESLVDVVRGYKEIMIDLEHPKDLEIFYKIQVDLLSLAALVRYYLSFSKINVHVKCFSKLTSDSKECKKYHYHDDFKNIGSQANIPLDKICNYILHRQSAKFTDNRPATGKQQPDTKLIYYLQSDELCDKCKIVNGYNNKTKYRDKKRGHVYIDNCTCGYYIDFGDLISKIKTLI